jgi:hypothetical protein
MRQANLEDFEHAKVGFCSIEVNSPRKMLPSDYLESRQRFLALAESLGAVPRAFLHDGAKDGDVQLSTDVAYLGPPDARTIVVIASGTHGVEGYAGAACQFHFMQTWSKRRATDAVAWLLVHAVNPWGYFHDRRVTQEGVDLNRNFVDFPLPGQSRSAYAAYHDLLISDYRPLPAGLWNELRLLSHGLTRKRRQALQAAITAGQYDRPDGLFFGGTAPTQSRRVWEGIMASYVDGRERAFLLDIHTGLGQSGTSELISHLPPASEGFRRMSPWFGGRLTSTAGGDSVSAQVQGTLTAAFDRAMAGRGHAIGLEFGTRPPLAVLYAMRADQWYRNNAAHLPQSEGERVRRRMKAAFCLDDANWRRLLLEQFDRALEQLLAGLAG